ncbi:hypothetical protein [Marinibacterium profundimaris]|uniref:hypothetical protein n=1 Tax=Marinibacterium profundimaris TaxID=1679460 RepID=UPI00117FBE8D|nr:hypothetical protein [Marinibacterium profundimaris]
MTFVTGALALCLGLTSVPLAQAQPISQILRRTGLTQADINIMTQSASTLYRGDSRTVGSEADWSNPDTGASGKSMLVAFADDCADVRHTVITQRRPEPQEFTFRNCKTADGNWMLAP